MVSERVKLGAMCGEQWAENLLYRRYYGAAVSFAQKLATRKEDAEEIANRAMFEAMRDIVSYNADRGKFVTWLYGIVKNTARDHTKSPRNGYGQ
jgi:RNA polymerase sigma factor (sigma-70 family)